MKMVFSLFFMTFIAATGNLKSQNKDPFLWLEEVDGKKALEWVEKKNKKSLEILTGQPRYKELYSKSLETLNSSDRIASPSIIGDHIYNFWQDAEHVRGIWRRTSKESYLAGKEDRDYPEVFFTTSTRDDRVHPGHARKMVAYIHK